jgi:hypothetical protein
MHSRDRTIEFFVCKVSQSTSKTLPTKIRIFVIAIIASLVIVVLGRTAGTFLVVDRPERGDAIVVLAGDQNDRRYYRALQVLNDGESLLLIVDSPIDQVMFGRTLAAQQEDFIRRTAGQRTDQVWVCPIRGDSTDRETRFVERCLQGRGLNSVILVTSDFHARRALSIFRQRLPQYDWSVAASRDTARFGENWWQHREWTKTTVLEWTKLIWWNTIDRWRIPENRASESLP